MNQRIQVFIVEDERLVALDLQEALERLGMDVVGIAHGAEEALNLSPLSPPDVLLLDISLGGQTDGIALSAKLRERWPDVPVVFLTAYSDAATLARIEAAEAAGYLTKPWESRGLEAALRLAVRSSRAFLQRELRNRHAAETVVALTDGLVAVDRLGRVSFANPAACRLSGRPEQGQIGLDAAGLYALATGERPVEVALRSGQDVPRSRPVRLACRPERLVELTVSWVRPGEAEARGVVLVLTDVTEREQIREALRTQHQRTQLAEQVAELAHELNGPLAAAVTLLAQARGTGLEQARSALSDIQARVDQLTELAHSFDLVGATEHPLSALTTSVWGEGAVLTPALEQAHIRVRGETLDALIALLRQGQSTAPSIRLVEGMASIPLAPDAAQQDALRALASRCGGSVVGTDEGSALRLPVAGVVAATTAVRPRLLLVDDDLRLGQALKRLLRRRFSVEVFGSAADAREVLESGLRPDLILCDVNMPGENGHDLYRWLSARLRERTVFMSGGLLGDSLAHAVLGTGRPVLSKPFSLEDVVALMEGQPPESAER